MLIKFLINFVYIMLIIESVARDRISFVILFVILLLN